MLKGHSYVLLVSKFYGPQEYSERLGMQPVPVYVNDIVLLYCFSGYNHKPLKKFNVFLGPTVRNLLTSTVHSAISERDWSYSRGLQQIGKFAVMGWVCIPPHATHEKQVKSSKWELLQAISAELLVDTHKDINNKTWQLLRKLPQAKQLFCLYNTGKKYCSTQS